MSLELAIERARSRMDDPQRISYASRAFVAERFGAFEPLAEAVAVDCERPLSDRLEAVTAAADELLEETPIRQ